MMQDQIQQKPTAKHNGSRNNKKKHHATHENPRDNQNHHRVNNRHTYQSINNTNNAANNNSINNYIACKICNQELSDLEKEFYPCNCKYKICQKCFKYHVEHENGKCPNCGLLYEVNRINEYYANKLQQAARQQTASQLQGSIAAKKTRQESPEPSMMAAASLSKSHSCMLPPSGANSKNIGTAAPMGGKNHHNQNNYHQPRNNKQAPPSRAQKQQNRQNQLRATGQAINNNGCQGGSSKTLLTIGQQQDTTSAVSNNMMISAAQGMVANGCIPSSTAAAAEHQQHKTPSSLLATPQPTSTFLKQQNSTKAALHHQIADPAAGASGSRPGKKAGQQQKRNSSEQQRNQQKLSSVRILQRNTLYVIGLSPNVAKEETLRRYEYFSQYGRILTVTINKEKAFQSENQGLCFSAYINYAGEREASLAILAVDQFVFDGRLLRASYGRTKYCRFFLKGTNCLNHECPYLHKEAHPENILTQEDMNKKILFQQCQQLALKLSKLTEQTEEQCRASLRAHKENIIRAMKPHSSRIIMPQLESIFEKKSLFKHCLGSNKRIVDQGTTTSVVVTAPTEMSAQATIVAAPQQPSTIKMAPANVPSQQNPSQAQQQLIQQKVINKPPQPQQQLSQFCSQKDYQHSLGSLALQTQQQTQQTQQQQQVVIPPPVDLMSKQQQTTRMATFKQHRGSHGCASEMQSSNTGMGMMFGGRNRLQSSGTLGELEFNNKNNSGINATTNGHQGQHQLLPHGHMNTNRRFAQDDHYLTRVPPADFRLQAATSNAVNNAAGPMFKAALATKNENSFNSMSFTNTANNNLQQNNSSSMVAFNLRPRFGSPHPPQNNRPYFQQQQFLPPHNQTSLHATRDSDKMTQQSSSQYQTNFHHVSQVQYHQPQRQTLHFQSQFMVSQDWGVQDISNSLYHHPDNRARSGSQAAMVPEHHQFEEAKMPERRRKSSHGKFRIFQEPCKESPSPTNKSAQRRFASKLRQALQQFIKGGDPATDGDSTEQFSSIFAGGDEGRRPKNKIMLNYNNCSEGVAGGQACSPIRDSILQSRRNSEDYGTLTRPRSQHSLIVESVARILDDTVIEQHRGDREKQRLQMTNEPNFKTGPPSEVHQLMYDVDQQPEGAMLNSHFYFDFESKLNIQFNDMASSNSMTTNPATAAHLQQHQQQQQTSTVNAPTTAQKQIQGQTAQKNQDFQQKKQPVAHSSFQQIHNQTPIQQQASQQSQCQNLTFTSPNQNNLGSNNNVWHQSNSLYNSPFFLIPTQTQNAQHRSAAYHDHTLRHLYSQSNPFSLPAGLTTAGGCSARGGGTNNNIGMANDTLRLTYNPHPLLPPTTQTGGGGGAGHSSNLSSSQTGGLFLNTTGTQKSDPEYSFPLLSRTTSQPFIMRSEQKVIQRGSNNQGGGAQQQSSIGGVNNMTASMIVQQRKMNNSQLEFSRSHQIQFQQQQQNNLAVQHQQHQQQRNKKHADHQQQHQQAAQLTQRNLELLNKKYCPSKDMLYAKIFTDFVPSSSPRSNKRLNTTNNQVSSFGGLHAPQHPTSVQHYTITPQSLFCFALDGDDSNNDLKQSSRAKLMNWSSGKFSTKISEDGRSPSSRKNSLTEAQHQLKAKGEDVVKEATEEQMKEKCTRTLKFQGSW